MSTLGERLKTNLDLLAQAQIRGADAKIAADLAKVKAERDRMFKFCNKLRDTFTVQINADKFPSYKEKSWDRQTWLDAAVKGKAKHQDAWDDLQRWAVGENLKVIVMDEHDGVGVESWKIITVEPLPRVELLLEAANRENGGLGREVGFGKPVGREII